MTRKNLTNAMALLVASATAASAATLSVDLYGSVATGFTAWSAANVHDTNQGVWHSNAGPVTSDTYTVANTGLTTDITAVMTSTTTLGDLANRNNAAADSIYDDTVNASGPTGMMTLTLNGLDPGESYSLTVYALDPNGGTASTSVRLYELNNNGALTVDNVQWSADDFTADYTFVAPAGGSVSVQNIANGMNSASTAQSAMNGFTLIGPDAIPEPSATALFGLGGLVLLLRRRR